MKTANSDPELLGRAALAGVRESVALARAEVRRWLGGDHPAVDDVVLAASELVTNAIVHSGCGKGDFIGLTVTKGDGVVRVEVNDPGSPDSEPEVRKDGDAEGGRGLLIVREISIGWGMRALGPGRGRTVWCVLRTDSPGCSSFSGTG